MKDSATCNATDAHCSVALLSDLKDSEIALESEPVTDQPKAATEAAEDGAADDGAGGEDGKAETLHNKTK